MVVVNALLCRVKYAQEDTSWFWTGVNFSQ